MRLNHDSMQRINNILIGLQSHPYYTKYDVCSYLYDHRSNAHAIHLLHNGQSVNLFLFFPGCNGEINSIAIYGASLRGHLHAILSSMKIFAMEVEEAFIDNQGLSPYVDVYLKSYVPLENE